MSTAGGGGGGFPGRVVVEELENVTRTFEMRNTRGGGAQVTLCQENTRVVLGATNSSPRNLSAWAFL